MTRILPREAAKNGGGFSTAVYFKRAGKGRTLPLWRASSWLATISRCWMACGVIETAGRCGCGCFSRGSTPAGMPPPGLENNPVAPLLTHELELR